MRELLDMLPDTPVTEYDLYAEGTSPWVNKVMRHWDGARSLYLVRHADHRRAKQLEDFATFDPIPSRQQVMDALEEAAEAWREELL
jgi:hypothetical protein